MSEKRGLWEEEEEEEEVEVEGLGGLEGICSCEAARIIGRQAVEELSTSLLSLTPPFHHLLQPSSCAPHHLLTTSSPAPHLSPSSASPNFPFPLSKSKPNISTSYITASQTLHFSLGRKRTQLRLSVGVCPLRALQATSDCSKPRAARLVKR
ncbi:hypothetical protein E2C01_060906 [Portunus trituberculatus]|uniref:Uncharacterized protein n=1 Tax=Portunus trituberculatus TaxID=210409 RepID=A0A5B7HDM3_PORTR|nr:hypothetical protein [Portunus trituberculatus]